MELLVIRHAIAQERPDAEETGPDDARRQLTRRGRRRFERGVRGIRRAQPRIDVLATSPLARATETAEIVRRAYDLDDVEVLPQLAPGADPALLVAWLRGRSRDAVVAVVGHEPGLSTLVAHLLAGDRDGLILLRKGGACLLELGDEPAPGRAKLRWLATASMLRKLA